MAFARRVRFLGLLAVLGTTVGPGDPVHADAQIVCADREHIVQRGDGWYEIAGPEYDVRQGDQTITKMEISPNSTHRLYVTNGVSVKRSVDDGCSWKEPIFPVADGVTDQKPPQADPLIQNNHVLDIAVMGRPGTNEDHDELWVASFDHTNGAYRPHVWRSVQADEEDPQLTEISTGLPAAGRPLLFAAGRSVGFAYLLVDVQSPEPQPTAGQIAPAGPALYRKVPKVTETSDDTWKRQRLPQGFTTLDGLMLDPAGSTMLWAWQGSKISRSIDGGFVWSAPKELGGTIASVSLQRNPFGLDESYAYVGINGGAGPAVVRSENSGKTWTRMPVPAQVVSVASGAERNLIAVSTTKGIVGYDLRLLRFVSFTPAKMGAALHELAFSPGRPPTLFARTDSRIYRKSLSTPYLFVPKPTRKIRGGKIPYLPPLLELPHSSLSDPVITPPTADITIRPGQTAEMPVEFAVPPAPIPLDVYFLVDTTTSMTPSIRGMQLGILDIVTALDSKGIDTRYGVGSFRDVAQADASCPAPPAGSTSPMCTYRRHLKMYDPSTDDSAQLKAALAALNVGGGGDEPEAQTIALTQAVNGNGIPGVVDPKQEAGFRPEATSVILFVTDAYFKQGGQQHPTIAQALTTLNAANVKVAGIVADNSNNDVDAARDDVEQVAEGTETVAPASGTDCNGDRVIDDENDVLPGGPLVCVAEQNAEVAINITPAIISLLLGIPDPGEVAVDFYGDTSVVKGVKGTTRGIYNLKAETRMDFITTFGCAPDQDGQDIPLALDGTVRGDSVARAFVTVHCRSEPKIDDPPLIFVPPVLPPPPHPPVLPPPPAPNIPFNPPQNPPPNINPNTGMASQEEQQFQLATVSQGEQEQEQDEEATEFAMSALDRQEPSTVPLLAGAALMSSVAGAAMRRRMRTQRATARW